MLFVVSCGELRRGGRRSIHDTEVIIYIIDFKHIEAHCLSHSVTVTDINISDYEL